MRIAVPSAALALLLSVGAAPAAHAALNATVINTDGMGVASRSAPQLSATNGYGAPANAAVSTICWAWGDAVGPNGNRLWWYISYAGRQFYASDRYLSTPNIANQPPAGEPQCGTPAAPSAPSSPAGVAPDQNAWFTLTAGNSSKVLDVRNGSAANGTAVQQYSSNGSASQKWRFVGTDGGYYRLVSALNGGPVLDVRGGGTGNGTKLQVWAWVGGSNQQWSVSDAGNGSVTLKPRHVGRCIDVPAGSKSSGVQLQLYDCNGTTSQKFQLSNVGSIDSALSKDVDAFVAARQNKSWDWDGRYGAQCVDLFNFYQRDVARGAFVPGDYAYQMWTNFPAEAQASYTKVAASETPRKGDVAVWDKSLPGSGGAGHVAIVLAQVDGSTLSVLSQNAPTGSATVVRNFSKSSLLGYLRPKRT